MLKKCLLVIDDKVWIMNKWLCEICHHQHLVLIKSKWGIRLRDGIRTSYSNNNGLLDIISIAFSFQMPILKNVFKEYKQVISRYSVKTIDMKDTSTTHTNTSITELFIWEPFQACRRRSNSHLQRGHKAGKIWGPYLNPLETWTFYDSFNTAISLWFSGNGETYF